MTTTRAAVSEKEQLEKDIAQLLQDNPTPRCLGLPIDADLRRRLQAWAKERKKIAEKRERLEMILEEERIQSIMRELDELHPQVNNVMCYTAFSFFILINFVDTTPHTPLKFRKKLIVHFAWKRYLNLLALCLFVVDKEHVTSVQVTT